MTEPYVKAMAPIVIAIAEAAADLLAAEASREAPDLCSPEVMDSLEGESLASAVIDRLRQDEANEYAVADLCEQAAQHVGLSTFSMAKAVGLASETLQLVDVRLRRRIAGDEEVDA
jgi:hypothetical protein